MSPQEELEVLDRLPHVCPVCAYHEWNLDGLVEMAWEYLDLIRVYTKPKARTPHRFLSRGTHVLSERSPH